MSAGWERVRQLFEAAAGERKRFVPIAGADHNDPGLTGGEELFAAVALFLREHDLVDSRAALPGREDG